MKAKSAESGNGPFGAWTTLRLPSGSYFVAGLPAVAEATGRDLYRLPYSIRILLENALRHCGRGVVEEGDVIALLDWDPAAVERPESAFMPARVLLQDFTGVPCVVDLAALRSAVARLGEDPKIIDPSVPVDLVIDHSIQVDKAGTADACRRNMDLEMKRNGERYALLRWAQGELGDLRVLPPGTGICHQVNLEYLAEVVRQGAATGGECAADAPVWAYPDTVIGTDSHTTMINGLGVLGWGVGGIEAEAVMLGQPYFMLVPQVVGVRLIGALAATATATDLVLTVTELLRGMGVVGRFVEFFGPGARSLSLPDRATIANMAPEYGATCGYFPIDGQTVSYLAATGRPSELCDIVEGYSRAQRLLWEDDGLEPDYSWVVELDLAEVKPSLAGPRRPTERVRLEQLPENFRRHLPGLAQGREASNAAKVEIEGKREVLRDGHVVIASIASCTNTSNPGLMMAAGLVARNAVKMGLKPTPWVRTSLTPGSRTVTAYLSAAGLLEPLEELGFSVAGYGCATCIGNSGPLEKSLEKTIKDENLVVAAVLSGNRNFEARIHPSVRANYLASPALVVAYALAGTVNIDLASDPLGTREDGRPVYLRDLWPSAEEVEELASVALDPELFKAEYAQAILGTKAWQQMQVASSALFEWDPDSTYVKEPPFLTGFTVEPEPPRDIAGARILAILGDSVTTDHISPAGSIGTDTPAGRFLKAQGVRPASFNTYGARRGNHEVLLRGTFANVRLQNEMAEGREGGWTRYIPTGDIVPIYDAAMQYAKEDVPLVVFAGKEYGTGSSRDWAAKGTALLGVKAVVAQSFERIHRSNLVGMGVLPLELEAESRDALDLDGSETVDVTGIAADLRPGATLELSIRRPDGECLVVPCRARLDSATEVEYFHHGGVLPRVLRLKLAGVCETG